MVCLIFDLSGRLEEILSVGRGACREVTGIVEVFFGSMERGKISWRIWRFWVIIGGVGGYGRRRFVVFLRCTISFWSLSF